MRRVVMLSALTTLLLSGCYEFPLTKEHKIPVDSAVLGLWELIPNNQDEPNPSDRLTILKYSDTEYMIRTPDGSGEIYYRGYPIKLGGIACVQLQALGTNEGPFGQHIENLFHVASYQLKDGKLTIRFLNTNLVEEDLENSDALRKAFLKHKNNKELFTNPGGFRKIEN